MSWACSAAFRRSPCPAGGHLIIITSTHGLFLGRWVLSVAAFATATKAGGQISAANDGEAAT